MYANEGSRNPRFLWQKQDLHPKAWASPGPPHTTPLHTDTAKWLSEMWRKHAMTSNGWLQKPNWVNVYSHIKCTENL